MGTTLVLAPLDVGPTSAGVTEPTTDAEPDEFALPKQVVTDPRDRQHVCDVVYCHQRSMLFLCERTYSRPCEVVQPISCFLAGDSEFAASAAAGVRPAT
jgi:hypothetical protein